MNRILKILLIFFLISNCSFNSNSKFWTKEANIENEKKVLNKNALFKKKKVVQKEFNSNLKIELKFDDILGNNLYNVNNEGIVDFSTDLKKISKYKFSKIKNFDQFQPDIIFNNDNLIFFDSKGSIVKFDQNSDLLWKKNF